MTTTHDPHSATLERVAPSSNPYLRLWRLVPRELGFLLLGLPIAVVGYAVTLTLFTGGIGTLVTFFIGLILIIAALYVSRGFGTLELVRLEWAGRPAVTRPEWHDTRATAGFFAWLKAVLGNGHYWLYLMHTMIIDFVVTLVSWTVTVVWVSSSLGGLSYWFWERFITKDTESWGLARSIAWLFGARGDTSNLDSLDGLYSFILGVILLASLPFVTRGLTLAHHGITASPSAYSAPSSRMRSSARSRISASLAGPPSRQRGTPCAGSSVISTTGRSSDSCACRWTSPRRIASWMPIRSRLAPSSARRCSSLAMHSRNCAHCLEALRRPS